MLSPEEKELVLMVASLIEQGSKGMRQITGTYFAKDGKGVCALGACLKAKGFMLQKSNNIDLDLLQSLGARTWPAVAFPAKNYKPFATDDNDMYPQVPLPDAIICLNDREGWSFERIVAYLRDCTLDAPR